MCQHKSRVQHTEFVGKGRGHATQPTMRHSGGGGAAVGATVGTSGPTVQCRAYVEACPGQPLTDMTTHTKQVPLGPFPETQLQQPHPTVQRCYAGLPRLHRATEFTPARNMTSAGTGCHTRTY
jgi:hypothetical protein